MDDVLPHRLKVAAAGSVTASLILVATPIVNANFVTVGALSFANWCLFIVTIYFASFPLPRWGVQPSPAELSRVKIILLVLLSFTLASWTAFASV